MFCGVKSRALIILLILAMVALLAACLIQPAPRPRPQNRPPETGESANPFSRTEAVAEGRMSAEPEPRTDNLPGTRENWALEPLPPGSNLQERLEELARRKGVPLNVLTQQALAQWSNVVQEMSQQVNRSTEFYGKAVDGNGMPL